MTVIVHHPQAGAIPSLTFAMAQQLLNNPECLAKLPELAPLALRMNRPITGGCSSCARRRVQGDIVSDLGQLAASLPAERQSALKALLGVTGPLKAWLRVGGQARSVTL